MNLEKDTWDVINCYFRDTDNYLVKHHIDSYNNFILYKIPRMFSFNNLGKQIVYREDKNFDTNGITYETHIYWGGKNHNNIYVSKPVIYDAINKQMKQLIKIIWKKIYILMLRIQMKLGLCFNQMVILKTMSMRARITI